VRDIGGPTVSRTQIDVPPDHDQTDNYANFFFGVADGGELTFMINLDPGFSAHVGAAGTGLLGSFEEDYNLGTTPSWEFENTGMGGGTATWTFDGGVTGFDFDMGAVEGSMEGDLTVKIVGKPTLTVT
jgi:hypothetical protein